MATITLKELFNNKTANEVLANLDSGVYRQAFPIHEMALEKLIVDCCHLHDFQEVLVLCTILDSFYSTRMPGDDIIFTARFIVNNHEQIRKMATEGNVELIKILSNIGGCNYNYSFATKLSNWLNHLDFPIYDHFVRNALLQLKKENVCNFPSKASLKNDYNTFKSALIQVVKNCNLTVFDDPMAREGINFKKLDKFIWALMNFVVEDLLDAKNVASIYNKIVYRHPSGEIEIKDLYGNIVPKGEIKSTLKELFYKIKMPFDDKLTTQQLGARLIKWAPNENNDDNE